MEKNNDLQNKEFNASKYGKGGRQCISASKVAEFEEDQHEKDHSWTLKQFLAGNRDGDSGGQQMKVQQ